MRPDRMHNKFNEIKEAIDDQFPVAVKAWLNKLCRQWAKIEEEDLATEAGITTVGVQLGTNVAVVLIPATNEASVAQHPQIKDATKPFKQYHVLLRGDALQASNLDDLAAYALSVNQGISFAPSAGIVHLPKEMSLADLSLVMTNLRSTDWTTKTVFLV